MAPVFECKKCGNCCQGRGGIVLSGRDLTRLAAFLGMTEEDTAVTYGEKSNGKLKIRTGEDGWCCFFRPNIGCIVHEGKPDICRAWPFFRGNLVDEVSFTLARDYCPGIDRSAEFSVFRAEGLAVLKAENLLATEDSSANALKIPAKDMGADHGAAHEAD